MTPPNDDEQAAIEAAVDFIADMLDVDREPRELTRLLQVDGHTSDAIATRATLASPAFQEALVERLGGLYGADELLDVVRFLLTSKLLGDEINLVVFGLMNPNVVFMNLSEDVVDDAKGPLGYAGPWIYLHHNPVAASQIAEERDNAWMVRIMRHHAADLLAQIFEVYHQKMTQEKGWIFEYEKDPMVPILKKWANSSKGSPLRAVGKAMEEIYVAEMDGTFEQIEYLKDAFNKNSPWGDNPAFDAAQAMTMGVLYEHARRMARFYEGGPVDWNYMVWRIFEAFFPNFRDDGREMSLSEVVEYYTVWSTEFQRLAELAGVSFEPVLARVL